MIHRLGYDLIRPNPRPRGFNARHLSTICNPRTVFDVGVADGTPELYEAFPKAHFVLVEPVAEYAGAIEQIRQKYDSRVFFKAVGSTPGEAEFTVDHDDPQKSSLQTRASLTRREHTLTKRKVEITTLDTILRECGDLHDPILLKIDTEGHELDALRGATELLRRADTVIAEVSVAKRFEGGYRFEDVLLFMRERGFRLVDILSIAHADGELEPHHMDVVFKKADA
jgi:FkbM family methyltransferase